VARQRNLTIHSATRHVEPAQRHEFNRPKDSVEDWDTFDYVAHIENSTPSERQPPPPLPRTEIDPGAGAPLIDHMAEPWERDAQGCLVTNFRNTPYYPFTPCEEYNYIQSGIKKQGINRYYDNVLKEESTALHFPRTAIVFTRDSRSSRKQTERC